MPATRPRTGPEERLAATADRVEIADLCVRYGDIVTQRRPEDLRPLFTEDAEWIVPGVGGIRGIDAIIEAERTFMAEYPYLIHAVHGTVVRFEGGRSLARSYCSEWGRHRSGDDVNMWGVYLDEAVRSDGRWRFARRAWHFLYRGRGPAIGRFYEMPEAAWP